MKKPLSAETALIHSDYRAPGGFAAFPVPIHHASTVLFEKCRDNARRPMA